MFLLTRVMVKVMSLLAVQHVIRIFLSCETMRNIFSFKHVQNIFSFEAYPTNSFRFKHMQKTVPFRKHTHNTYIYIHYIRKRFFLPNMKGRHLARHTLGWEGSSRASWGSLPKPSMESYNGFH